jgi:hypothetical protein
MKTLKNSDRKFIRLEKSRIRKKFWDVKKQEEAITELYKRVLGDPTAKAVESKKPAKKQVKVAQKQNKGKAKEEKGGKMKNKKKNK